jgi:poly(3-hydroxybutyrate) depolymerase
MPRANDILAWALAIGSVAACSSNAASGDPVSGNTGGNRQPSTAASAGAGSPAPAAGSGNATSGRSAEAGGTAVSGSPASVSTSGGTGASNAGNDAVAGMNGASAGASGTSAAGSAGAGTAGTGGTAAGSGGAAPAGSGGDASRVPKFAMTRCIDPSKASAGKELNFPCDGIDIWVVLPSQCMTKACGLVFNIHGGGMTDHATMDQATNMIALGSAADYLVVHPHKGTWDVARDKDVVFGFLQQVIEAFDVDRKRVHSTGYSQGGQISWAIGCEHADVVASIAPAEEINRVSDCWKTSKLPARDLSVLFAYGKQDSIGGGYDAAKTDVNRVVSTQQMMGPETIAGTENSKYWRQRWTGKSGNVLEFISQNYSSTGVGGILAGHCLPMSMGDTFVSCALPVDYDWGKEVIEFFKAHPAP